MGTVCANLCLPTLLHSKSSEHAPLPYLYHPSPCSRLCVCALALIGRCRWPGAVVYRRGLFQVVVFAVGRWQTDGDALYPCRERVVARLADGHNATVGDERAELEADDVLQQLEDCDDGRHQHVGHDQVRYLQSKASKAKMYNGRRHVPLYNCPVNHSDTIYPLHLCVHLLRPRYDHKVVD